MGQSVLAVEICSATAQSIFAGVRNRAPWPASRSRLSFCVSSVNGQVSVLAACSGGLPRRSSKPVAKPPLAGAADHPPRGADTSYR
jgi:hypothetical protein